MKKLKVANQRCSTIIGANGHINERSLADYEEGDGNEQLISSIISSGGQASRPLQNVGLSSAVENTLMMHEERLSVNYQLT